MNTLYFLAARHASCKTVAVDFDFVHQDINFLSTFRQPRCFIRPSCNEPALRVVQYDQIQQQMAAGGAQIPPGVAIGIIVGAGLFALVLAEGYEVAGFFVLRSKSVTQQFRAWDEVVNGQRATQQSNLQF